VDLDIYIKMVSIKEVDGRFFVVRNHQKWVPRKLRNVFGPEDYEFKCHVHGSSTGGYIHLGGKFIMFTPNQFIGKKVRLVLEVIE